MPPIISFIDDMMPWSRSCRSDVVFDGRNSTLTLECISCNQAAGWPGSVSMNNMLNMRWNSSQPSPRKCRVTLADYWHAKTQAIYFFRSFSKHGDSATWRSFATLKPSAVFSFDKNVWLGIFMQNKLVLSVLKTCSGLKPSCMIFKSFSRYSYTMRCSSSE